MAKHRVKHAGGKKRGRKRGGRKGRGRKMHIKA